MCVFTLAVDRRGDGADFINCVAWKEAAIFIHKWFAKGKMVVVKGHIQTRIFEDRNGNKQKVTEINVEEASFCDDKKKATRDELPPMQDDNETLPF